MLRCLGSISCDKMFNSFIIQLVYKVSCYFSLYFQTQDKGGEQKYIF